MSKAILVLPEMPDDCDKCPLHDYEGVGCYASRKVISCEIGKKKPDWCHLRLLPEKEPLEEICYSNFENGYKAGWNKAIEAIEGSREDD